VQPLNAGKPLWRFDLIEDYEGGSAMVVRIHHSIADGIALVGVVLSLTDPSPEAPPQMAPQALPTTKARSTSPRAACSKPWPSPSARHSMPAATLGQRR
jgi:hypothetical protein